MENENNSLFEDQNNNNNENNRRDLLKFILSAILNIVFVSGIITYTLKNNLTENILLNNNYKKLKFNRKTKTRYLDDGDNLFNHIERQITINTKQNAIEDEMKKYLSILLENFGGFESIKDIIYNKPYIITIDSYFLEKEKQIFLTRLLQNAYSGTWEYFPYIPVEEKNISKVENLYFLNSSHNKFKIGSSYNGSVNFNFKKAMEMTTKQEAIALTMKNLEGEYIDNWIYHISYAKLNDLSRKIEREKGLYILKGEFSTTLTKGKLFHNKRKKEKKKQCGTYVEISFPLTEVNIQRQLHNKTIISKNISTIIPDNFTMILSSSCGFRMKINAGIYNHEKEYFGTKDKIIYYLYFSAISSVLYLIGSTFLTNSLRRNEYAISCVCLEGFCQNLAWHSYCSISNINFGLIYSEYFPYFFVISVFSLINFIIFDLRFLFFYWRIKKRVVSDRQFIILRLKFFMMFYGLLILSFFSISSFFIDKLNIILISFGLWTPQIIHNIIYNNKYIYPTIFILCTTIDRMIYPFYFRFSKNNFLFLKEDKFLIILLFSYILLTIIILYLQVFLGARFMLPEKYQKKNSEFYKTKQEILEERPDCIKEECVICLSPLIEEDSNNNINKDKDNEHADIKVNSNVENENKSNNIINDKESTNKSFISRVNLINNSITINNIIKDVNNKKNVKNIKNGFRLHKKHNKNNEILVINIRNKEKKRHKKKTNNCLIKNIGKVIVIILFENMFKFYKLKLNFGHKKYMIIACGHMFHSNCVAKWFERKKECPSCRASMENYL